MICWFKKFREGNFQLENKFNRRPTAKRVLRGIEEADLSQSACVLALSFGLCENALLVLLRQINQIKILGKMPAP